ncbi:MAG TPA: FecR domain-containing protein, partial [Reyranella sp.]|nr:FecR domain-containing protein [Reyranella sp.]
SKSNVAVLLLLRAVLVGAAVLGLFGTAQAQGRIGVTQSIQNNPVGKPPGGLDRVLRVGTDVQANEIISTAADDRAHLVFLDGTTLTIGPSSSMTIDKFVYDPTTQKGELAVNATKGVFRIIGGRISKTSTIAVTTPSATMGIRGGIAVFGVTVPSATDSGGTTSILVYGNSLTVTAGGVTQTITVPGLSVSTPTGGTPGAPTIAVQGNLAAALATLAGNSTAAAATVAAIQTLVASNLGNAVTLQALIQAIVVANTATPITTTTTTTTLAVIVVPENPNQTQASPN